MSRMALATIALLAASPASAQRAVTAEQALARADRLTGVDADGCTRPQKPGEILVCGTPEINREQMLPFASNRLGKPLPRGESPTASAAEIRTGSCGVVQDGRPCNRGLDLLGAVIPLAIKAITRLVDPEAEVEPVRPIPRTRY